MDGIINIYKEKGFTSHDVVAKLRGILKQKKIGHTGTLDPDAEGVLLVCLGKATKLCDLLTDKDKTYEVVLQLGINTDTQDMTGKILSKKPVHENSEEIREAILSFVGEYNQIPPMYSALKVNGKKLYELAREGKEVERKPRQITIHEIEIGNINIEDSTVHMTVSCSKGTYIRALCYDIGMKLGCGGCMKTLIRTKVSRFSISESLKLSQVETLQRDGVLDSYLMSIEDMFPNLPKVTVKEEFCKLIYNGNKFATEHIDDSYQNSDYQQVRVYDNLDKFIGIYEYVHTECQFKPIKMFL